MIRSSLLYEEEISVPNIHPDQVNLNHLDNKVLHHRIGEILICNLKVVPEEETPLQGMERRQSAEFVRASTIGRKTAQTKKSTMFLSC